MPLISIAKQKEQFEATHPQTITSFLRSIEAKNNDLVVDRHGVCWKVGTLKKGYDLKAINCLAYIPYWACLKIQLPGLRRASDRDIEFSPSEVRNNLQEILKFGNVQHGNHYLDTYGILWCAKEIKAKPQPNANNIPEFELAALYSNASINWDSLEWISIPGFKLISTLEQRQSAKFIKTKHRFYR